MRLCRKLGISDQIRLHSANVRLCTTCGISDCIRPTGIYNIMCVEACQVMSDRTCSPRVLGGALHLQLPSSVRHVSCQDFGCGRIIMALIVCNKALLKDDRLLRHTWPSASLTALSTSSSGTSMMSSNRLHKKELSSSNTSTHGVPPSDSSAMNAISC